jgi:hypothetical protein
VAAGGASRKAKRVGQQQCTAAAVASIGTESVGCGSALCSRRCWRPRRGTGWPGASKCSPQKNVPLTFVIDDPITEGGRRMKSLNIAIGVKDELKSLA